MKTSRKLYHGNCVSLKMGFWKTKINSDEPSARDEQGSGNEADTIQICVNYAVEILRLVRPSRFQSVLLVCLSICPTFFIHLLPYTTIR